MRPGDLYLVAACVGLAAVTVATRGSFFMLPASVRLPEVASRALRYAPACALAAIVVPSVVTRHGDVYLSLRNYQMLAVIVGVVVFVASKNMMATMTAGMIVFTLLRLYA